MDTANRIAMFPGGSLAEGWACYVCDLMEEIGFLKPLERIAQQHTRVRIAARAVADLSIAHWPDDRAAGGVALRGSRRTCAQAAARAESVRNTMYPGTAVMYWLGTQGHASPARRDAGPRGGGVLAQAFPRRCCRTGRFRWR